MNRNMNTTTQIANQFKEVFIDGNWVATNLKAQLADVTWEQATTKIDSFNTIAVLVFHLNYYVAGILNVFEGGTLDIRDKYSFDAPSITSKEEWESLMNKTYQDAERLANHIARMPEEKLVEPFADEKYGNYARNIHGMIGHSYYHLGQIVLIKKML